MTPKRFYFDIPLLIYVVLLSGAGILFAYSSNLQVEATHSVYQLSYIRQTLFFVSGLTMMLLVSVVNYKKIAEYAQFIYIGGIVLLVCTMLFGKVVNNSKRWIELGFFGFQASEFIKVAMIVVVATYLDKNRSQMKQLKVMVKLLLLYAAPTVFIFLQPDLGTAMVYVFILFVMLLVGNVNIKYFVGLIVIATLSIAIPMLLTYAEMVKHSELFFKREFSTQYHLLLISFFLVSTVVLFAFTVWTRNLVLQSLTFFSFCITIGLVLALLVQHGLLKEYQRKRLFVFFNPNISRWDAGYNIIQSQITIGSGGFLGKGLFKGTQGQLGFLPSRNTDFIFSVIGEELGFWGSSLVIVVFYLFLMRLIHIARKSKDYLGSLIVMGITAMFGIQTFINIGMTIGVAPVTGLPLPFLTSGGSTMWTSLLALGLVFNVRLNRYVHQPQKIGA